MSVLAIQTLNLVTSKLNRNHIPTLPTQLLSTERCDPSSNGTMTSILCSDSEDETSEKRAQQLEAANKWPTDLTEEVSKT